MPRVDPKTAAKGFEPLMAEAEAGLHEMQQAGKPNPAASRESAENTQQAADEG